MNLDKNIAAEIISLAQFHKIKKVILFGSRAKGTNSERSDIDIAVSGGDFLSFAYDVDEKINTLLEFDVVNLDKNLAPNFRAEIEKYGVVIMNAGHFDKYVKSLNVLLRAEREKAESDEFYRSGVINTFNLTFELAWKSVKDTLEMHGMDISKTGSPREILKAAYSINFLNDGEVWLDMLKNRNSIVHIYDENAALELCRKIFDSYIAALVNLRELLTEKLSDINF